MSTTGVILTGCVLVLVVWDLIVVLKRGVGSSVSRTIQRAWYCSPIVVFGCGALFGHFALFLDPGSSVVAIPDNPESVNVVRIEDLKMNVFFVPDDTEIALKNKKTGRVMECPTPKD